MIFKSQFAASIPPEEHKDLVSNFFWKQLDHFAHRELFIDFESGRRWRGQEIKQSAKLIAERLIGLLDLRSHMDCVLFCTNSDYTLVSALAILFAGSSVCVGEPEDPEREQAYMVEQMRAAVVFINGNLLERMCSLRQRLAPELQFKLVVMDDLQHELPSGLPFVFGLHKHLLDSKRAANGSGSGGPAREVRLERPVQVAPERAAFVLFTSGSTGHPKPVGRSQRNSLYVAFSLPAQSTSHMWALNENSVLAGHLQLDHGTGTFSLKMTLSKGLKLVVMQRYDYQKCLTAIERYQITDFILGSALLHNFVSDQLDNPNARDRHQLGSLRNFLAVGSPIVSHLKNKQFMDKYPNCSIRQAFGMTECGFMTIVERSQTHHLSDNRTVGPLMPNLEIKLVHVDSGQEVDQVNKEGLLQVRGPTVSPGYMFDHFKEQSARSFLSDGFYVSSDICLVSVNEEEDDPQKVERLQIRGRANDMLYLYDGWKVLPYEIEQLLLEHPRVLEAAVVGVPHPELPSCHAPRAYVVLKKRDDSAGHAHPHDDKAAAMQQELYDFVAKQTAQPKHLIGGIKIMDELPRISIGKVDKKLLKRQDGLS